MAEYDLEVVERSVSAKVMGNPEFLGPYLHKRSIQGDSFEEIAKSLTIELIYWNDFKLMVPQRCYNIWDARIINNETEESYRLKERGKWLV